MVRQALGRVPDVPGDAVLLPLEVYELVDKASALKVVGFLINLAVVIYLLFAKRLFGLRGGGAVDEAERAGVDGAGRRSRVRRRRGGGQRPLDPGPGAARTR